MKTKGVSGKGQRGQALIMAMMFMLALTFLGFGLVTVATLETKSSRNLRIAEEVLAATEEGVLTAMGWASDPNSPFQYADDGSSFVLDSIANGDKNAADPIQYRVTLRKISSTKAPRGSYIVGSSGSYLGKVMYSLTEIQSTGFVSETPGINFSFSSTPSVRRTLVVFARIRISQ